MRHRVEGRKLNRTSSHKKALMCNLATSLFEHKKVKTTEAKAKELRPFAELIITKAKHALVREKQGLLPEGQKIDIHNRRIVGRTIRNKAVLQELFDTIAPLVEERSGGYCRITKLGTRRGDGGRTAIIELVDWSAPQDGVVSLKARKKSQKASAAKSQTKAKSKKKAVKEEVFEAEAVENVETDVLNTEEPIAEVEQVEETPEVEESAEDIKAEETTEEEVKEEKPKEDKK